MHARDITKAGALGRLERMLAMEQSQAAAERVEVIAQLAREASIEFNVQDLKHLKASRSLLPPGKRVYVSHLPKQRWDESLEACASVKAAGFDPIPHIPVRLIDSEATLDWILERAVKAGVAEVLFIAGDYDRVAGPYPEVASVLRSGRLKQHGVKRLSLAGHPEGHPMVALEEIRRAQLEKAALSRSIRNHFRHTVFF